ncbi:MerR family transcriptional regulator [Sporosarcina sp. 179-K 3D1 HS]|uniref:MerR family transcriptional regulator n=1 Tax=Sporosarcina sp. 179-K 3D1 HS TaxID=3232169 RepID=UPI0039A27DE4
MTPSSETGRYYIQQVADMTGLSKQVIRKWEERYGLIQPDRLANGYRIYSEKDINILLRVKALSEQGYSIKQAVELLEGQHVEVNENPLMETADPLHPDGLNKYVFQLLERGAHCDEMELGLLLQQAYHEVGLSTFLSSVVIPFLKEVGDRWGKKEWTEYQESVSSLIVRDFLVQIRRNYQYREGAPLVVGACLPYERHEIPVQIILLQMMLRGWRTMLIGASPAPNAIESLVLKLQPKKVLLSALTTHPFEQEPDMLQDLDAFAAKQPTIDFYLGGAGAIEYAKELELRAITIATSYEEVVGEKPTAT